MKSNKSMPLVLSFLVLAVSACSLSRADEGETKAPAIDHAPSSIAYDPAHAPPLAFVKTETVTESAGATSVSLPGRVGFDEDHTQRVASPIDGRSVAVMVKLGDRVRAGQTLVRLSSPNVGQLQADAQKAMSDLSLAQKSIDRVYKLKVEGAVADKEVAQAEGDFRKAKSDYGRAVAQLRSLGVSATDPAVDVALRSQVAGVVVERNVLVGQEVRADQATPLLTISNLDQVWVEADVYEQDMGLVTEGDAVTVSVPAYPGEAFTGKVGHVGDIVDSNSRTVKLRCTIDNRDHRLKPQMFAKVDVRSATGRKHITIPAKAVLNEGDRALVVLAMPGNSFRMQRIDVGPDVDGNIRVLGGLVPGSKVVTDGAIFMKREIERQ
jgi:cobalt-zinc-cadmium efflux system membrane fusion protein